MSGSNSIRICLHLWVFDLGFLYFPYISKINRTMADDNKEDSMLCKWWERKCMNWEKCNSYEEVPYKAWINKRKVCNTLQERHSAKWHKLLCNRYFLYFLKSHWNLHESVKNVTIFRLLRQARLIWLGYYMLTGDSYR